MTTETLGYFEIATNLPPSAVVTFHDVSWEEYERLIEEHRSFIAAYKADAEGSSNNARIVRQRLAEGDRSVVAESATARRKQNMSVGKVLAARMLGGKRVFGEKE